MELLGFLRNRPLSEINSNRDPQKVCKQSIILRTSSGALATEQTALGISRVQADYLMGGRRTFEVEQFCKHDG
jgi:hypothetical protein